MFLVESEILCHQKLQDTDEILVDSFYSQFPVTKNLVRVKTAEPEMKIYSDYTSSWLQGFEGECIVYQDYIEEPEIKKITSDELYKYYD